MRTKRSGRTGLAGAALVAAVAFSIAMAPLRAQAGILATASNVNPVTFSDAVAHYLPINGAAAIVTFTTTVPNQRVVVLFNGECAAKGADDVSAVDIDILIDGVVATPSSSDNAFCTTQGNKVLANWVSASTNAWQYVPTPGVHQLRVRALLRNFTAGEQYRIDDTSVIVMN